MSTATIDESATDELKRRRALEILESQPSRPLREVAREVGMPESTLRGVKKDYEASKLSVRSIPLDQIRTDGGTQTRAAMCTDKITEYAEAYSDGRILPPPVVYHDGSDYWLADGFHRKGGASECGWLEMLCEVRKGTKRDALIHSLTANAHHGLHRSNADKRHSVAIVLADPEWQSLSDAAIARMCEVSPPLVASVREELASTLNILSQTTRTTANGRVIDTANIGKRPKATEDRGGQKDEDEPDDGREPGSDDDAGEPVTVECAGDPEPDADAAYLATFPIRDKLSDHCRDVFDRDVLAYRKAIPWLDQGKALGLAATRTGDRQGAFQSDVARLIRGSAPHDWLLCVTCKGGIEPIDVTPCSTCRDRGYVRS